MAAVGSVDMDFVREVALGVRATILEIPDEPFRGAKSIFPAIWCERASIAVARVLSEVGLGEWTFVTAGLSDDPSGHAWLELRDEHGRCQFSIDVTLDQFEEWDEPFIGEGQTPAATRFTEVRFAGAWKDWPLTKRDETYADYAEKVVSNLDESGRLSQWKGRRASGAGAL